ncbi:hypothetical protein KJ819_00935 [Patescibacteria group bacterium]|nr:hypothetical protein [Patescibacteria group bacterium]MBU1500718.1 hypothetical protein [Patescibacteria group bacterium]MBU2080410.1 hypothetical protein [Patescibacteria group bacterium]MBU2124178.1 hypothetical protein [Patescibacteria group bacterium]MBU2194371.1 hypothetical protein [Patescibacteria group bacterium]
MKDTRNSKGQKEGNALGNSGDNSNFVLDKAIFSNVFERDIRRVYLYKKAERLAKAIHLVGPAFTKSAALKDRLDRISIALVDAAILPPAASREALSRELLALSSILSIVRVGGVLSPMNADLIANEAHLLLQEVAGYEEPRLTLEDAPTLASLAKSAGTANASAQAPLRSLARITFDEELAEEAPKGQSKGHVSDKVPGKQQPKRISERREAILSVLKRRGGSYIKDISLVIRDVSEKTIQRELSQLVSEGVVTRKGDRRWTTYEIAKQ